MPDAAGRTKGAGPRQPRRDVRTSGAIRSGRSPTTRPCSRCPTLPAEQKAQALVNRGWQYFVEGRIREAIEDEQHAVSLDPKDWTAHANLAVALLADGQTNAALAAYDAALALANAENLAEMTSDLEMATQKYGPLAGADEVLVRIKARRESLEH